MSKQKPNFDFIPEKGEMATLIREKDWSATAVGPPEQWPQSLRTILSVVLHSKFPMFIWWGPDLTCFYNDAYRPSLGKEGKHPGILGQPAKQAWAEIWPVIHPLIQQVLNGGEATWSEDQLIPIYRNGHLEDVYWTFSYSRINNDEGDPFGVLVTCVETTQKVLNQNKLEETAELLLFSTEAAELGTWDLNPVTGKFTGNKRLKSWFGLDPDEETDLQIGIEAIAPKDQERVRSAIADALDHKKQKPYDIEYTIINKQTGKEIIVLVKGKAYFDDKKIACRFSGTMEDITEQAKVRTVLEEAEERARMAVAAGNLGTFDLEIGQTNAVISDRFCEIFDVTTDSDHQEMVGRIHPEDLPLRNQAVKEAMETGILHYEVRVVHRNGTMRWVRADGKVFNNADSNKPPRMLGTVMDITDHKELEQKREEYIAIASHELKNPLTSLKLALDMLSSLVKEPGSGYFLNKSRDQVNRLIVLTNQLLNVSKISSGVLEIHKEVFHLGTAISDSIVTVEGGISADLFMVSGTTDLTVLADKFRIEQVLVNLLSNAVKYSPKGSAVQIHVQIEAGQVKISVQDKGIGIDEDKISQVFQKFSRLETSRGIEGFGLGLYISEQIIRKHGGKIGVESEKGKGSTFWFTIPL